jgi:aspartyl-tRNA(Asn)/glutamyl-tRNA(Gln) amidotransferase subunit A
MQPISAIAQDLAAGRSSSRALVEAALARIADPEGEGKRAFIRVFRDTSLAEADASDRLRKAGIARSPLEGVPVSVKDLCDVKGYATLAGSVVLKGAPAAARDAPVVARLRSAGAVVVGSTNMVEFALGATGLNPHYGTPRNPYDRATGRAPGGSSSGAAVSVTDGMAYGALGTDTAGSVRMPAAMCGLAGFKPTARRVPREGIVPLSRSLDSVGPLAATIECCNLIDSVFAAEPYRPLDDISVSNLRLGVPKTVTLDGLEPAVATAFEAALSSLSRAGARVIEMTFPELARMPEINRHGGFSIIEGYSWHRSLLDHGGDKYDPMIAMRFRGGAKVTAAEYLELLDARAEMIGIADRTTAPFDALVMPTVPMTAPAIEALERDRDLALRTNLALIRNCVLANFLDRCAVTIPCHPPGTAPVGLMLVERSMADRRLLVMARAIEKVLVSRSR